jgi:transcriptional regulator with XRE-family HTH domain
MASYSSAEQKLHRLLKDLRIEHGLTQVDLAKRIGEPQQVISKIERGHRRLYATQLFDYVRKGFGLSVVQFARRYEAQSR